MSAVLLNPDPGECSGVETPPLGDRFWYPLYEKMVELDIPGHIHSAGCRSERLPYSLHFINEESIAVVSLLTSTVFKDFPTLKILVSHGGGAIPYQFARFEAGSLRRKGAMRFSEAMRHLYYDTVLYSKDALELLFKTVGVDRCLFGTERPGVGTVKDPRTGRWLDETRFTIEAIDWLSDADKKKIFEDNAKKLFNLKVPSGGRRMSRARASRLVAIVAVTAVRWRHGRTRRRCRRSRSITRRGAARRGRSTSRRKAATTRSRASTWTCSSACIPAGVAMLDQRPGGHGQSLARAGDGRRAPRRHRSR